MSDPLNDVGNFFQSAGKAVENFARDPLPLIETVALTYALGPAGAGLDAAIAAPIAAASVSAANGGNIEQIAFAAGTAFAGSQIGIQAGKWATPAVQSALSDIGVEATKEMVTKVITSASAQAAVAAIQGKPLDQILTAGLSGAVVGGVTAQLQSITNADGTKMFPPGSISTSVIAAASGSAAKAILSGKSVGTAIAFAATNSAINWSLLGATEAIRNTYGEMTLVQDAAQKQVDQANSFAKTQNELVTQYNDSVNKFQTFVNSNNIGSMSTMILVDDKPMEIGKYISDYLQPDLDKITAAYKENEQSAVAVWGGDDTASAYANATKRIDGFNQQLNNLSEQFKTQTTDLASHVDEAVAAQVVTAANLATNEIVTTEQLSKLTPEQYTKYNELTNSGVDPTAALKGVVEAAANAISTPAQAAQDTTQPKPAEPQTQTVQAKYGYDASGNPSVYVINPLTGEKYFPPDVSIGGGPGSLGGDVDTPAPYYYTYGKDDTGAMGFAETTPPTDTTAPPTDTVVPPTDVTKPTDTTVPPIETTVPPIETTVPPTDTTAQPTDTTVQPTGISGTSGKSGTSGIYDYTGAEISGYSGESGTAATTGPAAPGGTEPGISGYSGTSGISGTSGTSGTIIKPTTGGGTTTGGTTTGGGTKTPLTNFGSSAGTGVTSGFIKDLTPQLTTATPFKFANQPTFTDQVTNMAPPTPFDYTSQIANAATGGSITDLKPQLTKRTAFQFAQQPKFESPLTATPQQQPIDYTQQILNAAQGGLIQNFAAGSSVGKVEGVEVLQPQVTHGRKVAPFFQGATLVGMYQPKQFADGGIMQELDKSQEHLSQEHFPHFFSEGGLNTLENRYVKGDGDGTSDSVPAMLANGEFVIPADVVSKLGNGSNDAGASVLDQFLTSIREHAQNHDPKKLPPDSKGPLAYLLDAKRKVG
jgi:hypothetical protein